MPTAWGCEYKNLSGIGQIVVDYNETARENIYHNISCAYGFNNATTGNVEVPNEERKWKSF